MNCCLLLMVIFQQRKSSICSFLGWRPLYMNLCDYVLYVPSHPLVAYLVCFLSPDLCVSPALLCALLSPHFVFLCSP